MQKLRSHSRVFLLCVLSVIAYPVCMHAQTDSSVTKVQAGERDGQRDFDFEFGRWKVHNRRLVRPLTGSNEWAEFDGTVVARPIWGGRANMDEFEADTPSGHVEGMTVRTYNPASHQWSIYWANQKSGVMSLPATVGKFTNPQHGEFYDQEDWNGKNIFVRFVWTVTSTDATQWEQAFSLDGGKTWETNWIVNASREKNSVESQSTLF